MMKETKMKKPVAPKKPTKPLKPQKTLQKTHEETTNYTTLASIIAMVPEGVKFDNVSIEATTDGCYDYTETSITVSWPEEVEDKQFDKKMKKYEEKLAIFNFEMEKYEEENDAYKKALAEWEAHENEEKIKWLEEELKQRKLRMLHNNDIPLKDKQ